MTTIELNTLAQLLNYPEAVPEGASEFAFLIDGLSVVAVRQVHGILLRFDLDCSESLIPDFAQYAAGRFLREEATLAWDVRGAKLFLWQLLPDGSDSAGLLQGFEQFVDSCEWWLARCAEKEVPQSAFPDILIRP